MQSRRRFIALAGAAALATAASVPVAAQQSPAEFYQDNTLTILLGHPPGGSYDLYAQLAAAHLGRFLPGNPTVIVQHMPGGGGSKGTAYYYNKAPRDGSTIGLFPETIAHTQLMDPQRGKWDVREMSYIGSFAPVNPAFVIRKDAPAKTADEMRTTETNVGCTGKTSQSYQMPAMLKAVAGMKFNMICGYDGSAAAILALQRGEVDLVSAAWNSWRSEHKDAIESGELVPVLQGGLEREEELADVPLMQEVVDDPSAKQALEFISGGAPIGRALIAPPDVPQDRLDALRNAFDQLVQDSAFLEDAETRGAMISPKPGTRVQEFSDRIMNAPQEIVDSVIKEMEG